MSRHLSAVSFGAGKLALLCVLLPALTLTGCASLFHGGNGSGPDKVDNLLEKIERVHVECELSGESVREAVQSLHVIVEPEFGGDPISAYEEFVAAVERSEARAKALDAIVRPMRATAEPFFEEWAANLNSFTSMDMRLRSQERLTDTLARYEAIIAAVDPAQRDFELLNRSLRDHALFLASDFNAAAVASLDGELTTLTTMAGELDDHFDACLTAAQDYVRAAALPGQMEFAEPSLGSAGSSISDR